MPTANAHSPATLLVKSTIKTKVADLEINAYLPTMDKVEFVLRVLIRLRVW